jgi:hypothetical protein
MQPTVNHLLVLYGDGNQMHPVLQNLIQIENLFRKRINVLTKDRGPGDSFITVERRIPR